MEPTEYLSLRNLQTALEAMSVADGYHYDIASLAVKLDPNYDVESLIAPAGPRPFVLVEAFSEHTPERFEYSGGGELKLTMPVTVHWVSSVVPASDENRLQVFLRGVADVERAIAQDLGRGGHAIDTRIVKRTFDTAVNGTQVWAMVDIEITARRQYGAPDA